MRKDDAAALVRLVLEDLVRYSGVGNELEQLDEAAAADIQAELTDSVMRWAAERGL